MSNKIVPAIYRAVIDDVIASIRSEFDEYGVGEEVLAELQNKWETKVIASHVAEFEAPPAPPPPAHPQHPPYPPHPMHAMSHYPPHNPYPQPPPHPQHPQHTAHLAHQAPPPPPGPGQANVKSEPVDNRYMLSTPSQYNVPPLPGPQIPGAARPPAPAGQQNVLSFSQTGATAGRPPNLPAQAPVPPTARYPPAPVQNGLPPTARIPQVDGPSSSSSDSETPPPSQTYAPRSTHPSLPQPSQSSSPSKDDDSEAINSDLDDSDSDNDQEGVESGAADSDIVFCTYDKVARVKNKWKCILKDGMIHINGKDYLFAKCTGEFEW